MLRKKMHDCISYYSYTMKSCFCIKVEKPVRWMIASDCASIAHTWKRKDFSCLEDFGHFLQSACRKITLLWNLLAVSNARWNAKDTEVDYFPLTRFFIYRRNKQFQMRFRLYYLNTSWIMIVYHMVIYSIYDLHFMLYFTL